MPACCRCVRLGLSLLLPLLAAPALAAPAVTDIDFDWSSYLELAPGSDNWPLTWCEDDRQYTSWGDGGGFGGTNTEGRVSLGFGRVDGPYSNFSTRNLWGGADPDAPATFNGKVVSMVCIGGRLYAWHSPGSDTGSFQYKQLIVSDDKGLTWLEDAFPSTRVDGEVGGPGLPYSLNYGKNYGANADGYFYTYWIRIADPNVWEVQVPGVVWLMRAPVANEAFTDSANWQWFTGLSGGQPTWGSEAQRKPVLSDADGKMRGSAIYVPGLDRYLMVTNHTARNQGHIAIWEAPRPWGPWSSVMKEFGWPSDPDAPVPTSFAFGVFSPRWFSADGRSGVFVFFRPDSWNSVAFTLPEPGGGAGLLAGTALLAGLARGRAKSSRSG